MSIEDKISQIHGGDAKQLEVILSDQKRMVVEAPAGYGKTATMVSRIAYLYSKGMIPNPKKVLALTFSVNAALKIKRDVAEKLPELIAEGNNPVNVSEKVTVTNYHGFCKSVLKKYGYLITPLLKRDINLFYAIGDTDIKKYSDLNTIPQDSLSFLLRIDENIKQSIVPAVDEIVTYNQIIIDHLLPRDMITHTAVILMALELFNKKNNVKKFYQNYYPLIVVDEFQDTNCIAWELLKQIIGEKSQVLLLGDPLQRIYGFIGAVPNIMETSKIILSASKVELDKNYRFKDNFEMLKLDKNIRANAYNEFNPTITDPALLDTFWASSQKEEAEKIIKKISDIRDSGDSSKIAILFRGRGENSEVFEQQLEESGVPFFYGMFTDDDKDYVDFHNYCQERFIHGFGTAKSLGKKSLEKFADSVRKHYQGSDSKMTESLLSLLDAFIKKVSSDYGDISADDKYSLIIDTFENRQLKQAMEYVESDLILSTIHGAKGLEWSYVFIVDFERWGLPGYFTCKDCVNKFTNPINCACPLPSNEAMNVDNMLDELSVFYVAITRARKQVYVSASAKRGTGKPGCLSCFSHLAGIKIRNAEE